MESRRNFINHPICIFFLRIQRKEPIWEAHINLINVLVEKQCALLSNTSFLIILWDLSRWVFWVLGMISWILFSLSNHFQSNSHTVIWKHYWRITFLKISYLMLESSHFNSQLPFRFLYYLNSSYISDIQNHFKCNENTPIHYQRLIKDPR